jgi:putative PEP-CTERM system histidine kinase
LNGVALTGFAAAAIGHAAFGLYLRRRLRASSASAGSIGLLVTAVMATAGWATAEFVVMLTGRPGAALLALGLDLARYGLWLALLLRLSAASSTERAQWLHSLGVSLILIIVVVLQGLRVAEHGAFAAPDRALVLALLALAVTGLYLLERLFRALVQDSRWGLKPILLALAIVFCFDLYMAAEGLMLGRWNPDTASSRGLVHMLAVPLLVLVLRRRNDWLGRIRVSRVAAFHSLALALAGSFLMLLAAIGYFARLSGMSWGHGLQIVLAFVAIATLATLAVSGAVRARVRVFVSKHFYDYRFDYREQWLRFTAALSAGATSREVGEPIVRALSELVECPAGSVWTRNRTDAPFTQTAVWNVPRMDAAEPADGPFVRWLEQTGWIVDLDEYRAAPQRYRDFPMPSWLLGVGDAWLIVPLVAAGRLHGFVILSQPRTPIEIDWEVLDLLKTASRQAAGYLAQMQATEALLEARKFDAFNRMSAFVVHDLKNIVTQLSLMLKNAERLHANPEFQRDMLLTVESSLEKMRRLMLQLREGEAPAGVSLGVQLTALAERLGHMAARQQRRLEIDVPAELATRGHEDRLERVLGHLVQNALDATPASGRVWLKAGRHAGQVRIEVGDTGAGMSEEFVRTRLFTPFSSTKHSGMGVGAFESAQYVRELGGSIDVKSEPGAGTVFTITLPVFENR